MTERGEVSIRNFRSQADINFVISGQLALYKTEFGLNTPAWIAYVNDGVNALIQEFEPDKDCLLILEKDGIPSGSIAITHDDSQTAKLRFFFLNPDLRGFGAGTLLMETAVNFCRGKYKRIYLWTYDKLDAARYLYRSAGFKITEMQTNDTWGDTVLREERWELAL